MVNNYLRASAKVSKHLSSEVAKYYPRKESLILYFVLSIGRGNGRYINNKVPSSKQIIIHSR